MILIQTLRLSLQFSALVENIGEGELAQFLATNFAQVGMLRIATALGLAAVAWSWIWHRPTSLVGWVILAFIGGGLIIAGAWLMHGASRTDTRVFLMAMTVLHQLAAVAWMGGSCIYLLYGGWFGETWR